MVGSRALTPEAQQLVADAQTLQGILRDVVSYTGESAILYSPGWRNLQRALADPAILNDWETRANFVDAMRDIAAHTPRSLLEARIDAWQIEWITSGWPLLLAAAGQDDSRARELRDAYFATIERMQPGERPPGANLPAPAPPAPAPPRRPIPPRPRAHYEYLEIEIPLDGWKAKNHRDVEAIRRVEQAVQDRVRQEQESGWQPDEPLDFTSLWNGGRMIGSSARWRLFGLGDPILRADGVRVRLRGLVRT